MIEAPLIVSNTILYHNNNKEPAEIDDQASSSPQAVANINNVPSIIEIVKCFILCGINDEFQKVDDRNILESILSVARDDKLDNKQHQSFQLICYIFVLSCLDGLYLKEIHWQACSFVSTRNTGQFSTDYKEVVELLSNHGNKHNIFFLFSGAGGSRKSHAIHTARKHCSDFCKISGLPFEKGYIYINAAGGSAAALCCGKTLYTAAGLNEKIVIRTLSII